MSEYLTAADAARLLGVTAAAVHLMRVRGELSVASRTEGGIYLFRRTDVEALVRARAERVAARGR